MANRGGVGSKALFLAFFAVAIPFAIRCTYCILSSAYADPKAETLSKECNGSLDRLMALGASTSAAAHLDERSFNEAAGHACTTEHGKRAHAAVLRYRRAKELSDNDNRRLRAFEDAARAYLGDPS